ncbi:addiction module protein [Planctomycetota bacterium]
MKSNLDEVLKDALALPPNERAGLVDRIISSLDSPDENIDRAWRKEITQHINAYRAGNMETISTDEILNAYRKR